MSKTGKKSVNEHIAGRIIFGLFLLSTIWCILALTTKLHYRKVNTSDIKIEKDETVRVTYNNSNVSHKVHKVTFSYDDGNIQVTEKYRLDKKQDVYLYNKLVKEHVYYTCMEGLAFIMFSFFIISLVLFMTCFFDPDSDCFSKFTYEPEKFFNYRSKILKSIMSFCGYPNIKVDGNSFEIVYNHNNTVPKYRDIWNFLKQTNQE